MRATVTIDDDHDDDDEDDYDDEDENEDEDDGKTTRWTTRLTTGPTTGLTMETQRLCIDGVWREGEEGRAGDVVNPASEEVVGRVAHASAADVDTAIDAAARALPEWSRLDVEGRAAILDDAAIILGAMQEECAAALTREQGKTLAESRHEILRAIETLRWHGHQGMRALAPVRRGGPTRSTSASPLASAPSSAPVAASGSAAIAGPATAATSTDASTLASGSASASASASIATTIVRPEPIGVVGAFVPWNYPAVIAARKVAAALIAGCTVVLKGPEDAPSVAAALVRALMEAGLPPGVVNLVTGDPPAIGARVLDSPVVRAVSFTGSTAVGRQLAQRAAAGLKRCVFELGGHAPVLVFADADLDAAVEAIRAYKFECAGQSCNAPGRVYVERSIYDRFVDRLAALARAIRVGDGADPSIDMGPLANTRRLEAMTRLMADAVSRGARVVTGGARLARRGYFWPPTILTDVPDTAAMMTEEVFGPLLPVVPFSSFDEAIARANASPYGLAAYVFTRTPAIADAAARALAAGSVGVNELRGVPPDVGIAGIKDSGYGYEGGRAGIEAFLNLKVVRGLPTAAATTSP